MNFKKRLYPLSLIPFIWFLSFLLFTAHAQAPVNPRWLNGEWQARWISCPGIAQRAYGVYHFRKTIELPTKPEKFIIHVSGDNRYRLFINGLPVCSGPARGDLTQWYFESVDIAPFLKAGQNLVAAQVWNMGEHAAVAQISNQTGFIVQGDTDAEKVINTNNSWKVIQNQAYTPCSTDNGARLRTYMVIGPGDQVEAAKYPFRWETPAFDDTKWPTAAVVHQASPMGYGTDNNWTLAPRNIPLMEETRQAIKRVRRSSEYTITNEQLVLPLKIPANSTVSVLFDQEFETVAYPELNVSGGKDANIKITYAEALFKDGKKGNRNEIEGREIIGNYDIFVTDGGPNRHFRPLWLRTYRYLQLDIVTKDQALTINELYGTFSAYPFEVKASFKSNDPSLQDIWDVGWRTARLCAGETYFDCPYYEQLQYEGDTRIQALISLYMTGDDRLVRKAINDFHNSRVPEGLTQGRFPSNRLQVIPPFSMYWVSMIHDYWMHRRDDAFVRKYLSGMRGVLDWYEAHIDKQKNMLGPMKWWNFNDWVRGGGWQNGTPPGATNGHSAVLTLQLVYTLNQAAKVLAFYGYEREAERYLRLAGDLATGTYQNCFDARRGLMADTPEKQTFSQHASIMGVLSGAIPTSEQQAVMQKTLDDNTLSQATFYYRFYLNQALKKAGMANLYYAQLAPWREMLKIGLTTFAEEPEPTRSDCHAWSASPNYDLLATVCGIIPAKPGFEAVRVQPALGELQEVEGRMPHPKGEISVKLRRNGPNGLVGEISLPDKTTGIFLWNGQEIPLKSGKQAVKL